MRTKISLCHAVKIAVFVLPSPSICLERARKCFEWKVATGRDGVAKPALSLSLDDGEASINRVAATGLWLPRLKPLGAGDALARSIATA
jgi:hypothetical protein